MAYTNIDDPSAYFHTLLWTGNGADNRALTNDANAGNFKPDWVWVKGRSAAEWHNVYDSSRGANKSLYPNDTYQEESLSETFESFDTNGFTVSYNSAYGSVFTNKNSTTYVAWQWKANGGTTTAFGESGSNPGGTRQTNTAAGFSIIAYTGTGSNGTIAHGLPSTPEFLIFKRRDATQFWCVWHQAIGDDYKLALHLADGLDADGAFMASTLPTSTNITVGGASVNTNADNGTYICYAFSPVQGYSKFGKYVGNGNANGAFVYTGFKPAWVMLKRIDSADSWAIFDNKRSDSGGFNVIDKHLRADTSGAEYDPGGVPAAQIDILSNGFKQREANGQLNASGGTYIYMAFAENPFVTSTGVPTTAR
jgi:hypothetical protein